MVNHPVSILFDEQAIATRIVSLAQDIMQALPPDMMIVALLRGSFMFMADLIRALHAQGAQPQIDFMTLSSYGGQMKSSGTMTVNRDIGESVQGRHVLVVDDILESGRTLKFACDRILERGAASLHTAVLLEKPGKRECDIHADFVGFTVPDRFVVGYGLDYANYYRELPFIGVIEAKEGG